MTAEQYNKLDSCYFQYDLQQNCEEEILDARRLVGSNRFDLYVILLYIDHRLLSNRDNKWQRWLITTSVAIKRRGRQFRKQYYQTRNKVLKGIGIYNILRRMKKALLRK